MAWLNRGYRDGHFVVSGRQIPRTGGMILARGEDRAQIEALAAERPVRHRRRRDRRGDRVPRRDDRAGLPPLKRRPPRWSDAAAGAAEGRRVSGGGEEGTARGLVLYEVVSLCRTHIAPAAPGVTSPQGVNVAHPNRLGRRSQRAGGRAQLVGDRAVDQHEQHPHGLRRSGSPTRGWCRAGRPRRPRRRGSRSRRRAAARSRPRARRRRRRVSVRCIGDSAPGRHLGEAHHHAAGGRRRAHRAVGRLGLGRRDRRRRRVGDPDLVERRGADVQRLRVRAVGEHDGLPGGIVAGDDPAWHVTAKPIPVRVVTELWRSAAQSPADRNKAPSRRSLRWENHAPPKGLDEPLTEVSRRRGTSPPARWPPRPARRTPRSTRPSAPACSASPATTSTTTSRSAATPPGQILVNGGAVAVIGGTPTVANTSRDPGLRPRRQRRRHAQRGQRRAAAREPVRRRRQRRPHRRLGQRPALRRVRQRHAARQGRLRPRCSAATRTTR